MPHYTQAERELYRQVAFVTIEVDGHPFLELWIFDGKDWFALETPFGMDKKTLQKFVNDGLINIFSDTNR